MEKASLPARPKRFLGSAIAMTPLAFEPLGKTGTPWTDISSRISNSTASPTRALVVMNAFSRGRLRGWRGEGGTGLVLQHDDVCLRNETCFAFGGTHTEI